MDSRSRLADAMTRTAPVREGMRRATRACEPALREIWRASIEVEVCGFGLFALGAKKLVLSLSELNGEARELKGRTEIVRSTAAGARCRRFVLSAPPRRWRRDAGLPTDARPIGGGGALRSLHPAP